MLGVVFIDHFEEMRTSDPKKIHTGPMNQR